MKNNTDHFKMLLNQALSQAPNDFALQEAKGFIKKAIASIENVESKRVVREQKRIERKNLQTTGADLTSVLNAIEKEMSVEKMKLEQIKSRKNAIKIVDQDDQNGLEYVMG